MNWEFNRVTYAIPCTSFNVESYVSSSERLPIVTEFAVRIIRIARELPILALRAYLGLSERETSALVDELVRQRLVEITDDSVALTAYAISHFEDSSDELPRFSAIEKRFERVDFELLTFAPVMKGDAPSHAGRSIVIEPPDAAAISRSNQRAEAAYQDHFDRILRMKGAKGRHKLDLYKVTLVEAERSFFVPVPISFKLDDDGNYSRDTPNIGSEAPADSINTLDSLISDSLHGSDSSGRALAADFANHFDDKVIQQFCVRGALNWGDYLKGVFGDGQSLYSEDTRPLLGTFYVERNREIIGSVLKESLAESPSIPGPTPSFWLAPDVRLWGRNGDTKAAFEYFARETRQTAHLAYPSDRSAVRLASHQAKGLARKTHFYEPSSPWKGQIEIFLVADAIAAVAIHLPLDSAPGVTVAIGFVTRNRRKLEIARRTILDVAAGDRFISPPENKSGKFQDEATAEAAYGNLNFTPITLSDKGASPFQI